MLKEDKSAINLFNLNIPKEQEALKDQVIDQVFASTLHMTIKRKSNNFSAVPRQPKRLPVTQADRQRMAQLLGRLDEIVTQERDTIEVEQLLGFVQEVTSDDIEFEIPRYHLETLFHRINEKLDYIISSKTPNIYVVEVLLDCLKHLNA